MSTATKERPIIFSSPMVRAILDGRKTQTRRLVKPQPSPRYFNLPIKCHALEDGRFGFFDEDRDYACPYGSPGCRLWVRETWLPLDNDHKIGDSTIAYRASMNADSEDMRKEYIAAGRKYQWRPSIHMPRWASRITLEITGVRVERMKDISEADAMAEGFGLGAIIKAERFGGRYVSAGQYAFFCLWEKINGPDSWAANPFVWVIEFKRIEKVQP